MAKGLTQETLRAAITNEPDVITWGFDDLAGSVSGIQLDTTRGKVDVDWDESAFKFEPSGALGIARDRVQFNRQKLHSIKKISTMNMHIHWEQTSTAAIIWSMQYRIQGNGEQKNETWSDPEHFTSNTTNNVFIYSSGTLNQITKLSIINWADVMISSTVQIRLARTDLVGGNVLATFIDGHVVYDQHGSNDEYDKVGV